MLTFLTKSYTKYFVKCVLDIKQQKVAAGNTNFQLCNPIGVLNSAYYIIFMCTVLKKIQFMLAGCFLQTHAFNIQTRNKLLFCQ